MSNFSSRKKSPTGNDMKSTQGAALRQQGFHDVNRRRAFLQDNSWIKRRPEEEKDENYGRVVLNRHNSHDALDRKITERNEPKATISRYRSDDTLDRTLSTFKTPEATKTPAVSSSNANTTTMATTPATTPGKKKRQSWFPPPPPGHNASPSTGASRRDPAVHPPIPPKPCSPIASPKQLRRNNRQIHAATAGANGEANRHAERNTRTEDLDDIVSVAASLQKTDKGEELDNLIRMNKSLNRNQGLDGLFRANLKGQQIDKRAQSLESLIYMNTQMDRDGKGNQAFGSLKKINQRTDKEKGGRDLDNVMKINSKGHENTSGKQDIDGLIKVNSEANKNMKRGQSLDNLIKVTPEVNRSNQGGQGLDNFIKAVPTTNRANHGYQHSFDELINTSPKAVKTTSGHQDLDKFIKVNPDVLANNQRNHDLDGIIRGNPTVIRHDQSQDLDNLIKVKPSALRNTNRDQGLENLAEVDSHASENKNGRLDGQVNGFTNTLLKESTRTSVYSYEARNSLSSNTGTRNAGPKDTVIYTRTYVENSKSPKDGYQENISGKYIQTVYSTSDRSVIERDMCTYCRKPLGVETKMILDELQICCHSTCFKCEICKKPLENLQAGDSIWIYRQTIHCEPCYSKVMAKWIQ
ncbi:sciellin isoform X1 [Peromyscus californicus insignis]|uniref:sciellin isoform X1 n=1 Tax=Peromyscus californicus insignis TaxID=564181 RepID=UPI0022A7CD56|nr:sciellin isoform X1 [Peromyscus californicus insignis]XP_052588496.1 sciellin isoform X1 [Peromyscus californicus insignis]